jgi:hypothetical protein
MKCNFCDKKVSNVKKLEVLIKPHLNSDRTETVVVELCINCIKRIKGEIE